MPSTESPDWLRGPATCGSSCRTSAPRPGPTLVPRARTPPRSETGAGPTSVACGGRQNGYMTDKTAASPMAPELASEPSDEALDPEANRPTRIAIVGVGFVGSTFAYALLLSGLAAEIVLVDVNHERAEGEAMDLNHTVPFAHPTRVWAGEYADCKGAIVTV